MANNQIGSSGADAYSGGGAAETQTHGLHALQLENARARKGHDAPGSDPYNTSGSFDRTKNWERVRKR